MFFPIGDDNTGHTIKPYINYVLIALNVLIFIFLQGMGANIDFTYAFATVPAEILRGTDIVTGSQIVTDPLTKESFTVPGLQPTPIPVYLTTITAMFMHGGWLHLFGNMLYLWVFGDNLENRLGHVRYLMFYLVCGILASLSHVFFSVYMNDSTLIPSLGASGAISGVLGGYLLLFPKRKVRMFALRIIISVPAIAALGIWIVFQLISGIAMLNSGESGGVAYAAHIGGFFAGLLLIKLFDRRVKEVKKSFLDYFS
jgi:membrane associated rhomboid family serine protease